MDKLIAYYRVSTRKQSESGLGLVRPLVPLKASPLLLGESDKLAETDPVLIVNYGGREQATLAYVVSRRPFIGSLWHISKLPTNTSTWRSRSGSR